jgi:transcriptional regulator with XRE-family HTH domain
MYFTPVTDFINPEMDGAHRTGWAVSMAGISPRQIRAARSLLGWTQQELADRAVVSGNTVQRLERGVAVRVDVYLKLWRTLEAAGIEFIPAAGDKGEGVRLVRGE